MTAPTGYATEGDTAVPVFNAHIPAGRFSPEQKRALADALNQSLAQGLGIPEEDRWHCHGNHVGSERRIG
jgi:hypothetical protein